MLPVALLAPWWTGHAAAGGGDWYLGVLAALVLAPAFGLAWALTAGRRGGGLSRRDLWGERRRAESPGRSPTGAPWWWYIAMGRWSSSRGACGPTGGWRSIVGAVRARESVALRFALAWVIPWLFVILTLISGKQLQYLFPLLPVFAILAGTAIAARPKPISLSLVSPALLIVAHLAAAGPLAWRYDLRPAAAEAKDAERAGRPVAYVGGYEGQLRLSGPSRAPRWKK